MKKWLMALIAANIIFLWPSTNGTIPSGFTRETALDDKYPRGTATGVDPGGTGGALTHTHTQSHNHAGAHTHTVPTSGAGSGSTSRDTGTTRPPAAHTHTAPSTTNPTANLADETTATTSADNNEPAFFKVIFIKSDGTPTGVPVNAVGIWNTTTAPSGWNLCDAGAGRPDMRGAFLKGAAAGGDGGGTGGAATHTHANSAASHSHGGNYAHDHPTVTSDATGSAGVGGPVSGANAATATLAHTHVITVASQPTDTITANSDGASGSGGNEPPYVLQGFIQNNNAGADLPVGIVGLWTGTLATIPSSWVLCDGANGTADLRNQYVKGATTLAGVGGTGGSTTHNHTGAGHTHAIAAHTHTLTHASGAGSNETAGAVACATTTHTHTWGPTGSSSLTSSSGTPTIANNTTTEPPYYDVAYIAYNPGASYAAALDTNLTVDVTGGNVQKRLRIDIENSGAAAGASAFKVRYSKNGGAYADVTASSSNVKTFNTSWFADGDDVGQLISTGTYQSDNNAAEESTGAFTLTAGIAASTKFETEIALEFVAADLADADTLDFRVTQSDGTVLDTYTVTPRATIVKTGAARLPHSFFLDQAPKRASFY